MKFKRLLALGVVVIMLPSCIKNTDLIGYTFKNENLDQVKVGQSSEDDVKQVLGTPSTMSTYGKNTWYYVSTETQRIAFLKPKIKHQKIVAVTFNNNSIVESIGEYSENDAKDIDMVSDFTKTEGSDVGVIGQLLGNVGRFNSDPTKAKINKPRNVPR